jgi:predicted Zn-dependent protease
MVCLKKITGPLVLLILIPALILPLTAPGTALAITIQEEEELSRDFMKIVASRYEFVDDPMIVDYVNRVGQRILAVMPTQPFPFHFYVIKQDVYNAFATPAGHIFVNSGLIEAMDSEEELAGILGHEMSHVLCRHISQKIDQSHKVGIATLAGVAAGVFLGIGGAGAAAANALTFGSVATAQSVMLAYSREDEMQADQLGLEYLTKAGYNAKGLLTILKKIRAKQWYGSKDVPSYLMTHPAIDDRIAYIDTWAEAAAAKRGKSAPSVDPSAFNRVHTRLVALYGNEESALRDFANQVARNPQDLDAQQGYGLILARVGKRSEAIEHFKLALEKRAFDPYLLSDIGRVYFLDGRYDQARSVLESAIEIHPRLADALFFLGRTRAEQGDSKAAVDAFQKALEISPQFIQVLYFLGESYGKLGQMADAHYYLGWYYKKRGDFRNAVFHLKKALTDTTDPDRKTTIKAMIKDIGKLPPEATP